MGDQITLLEIASIDPPVDAARDTIDPDKIRELAESIRSEGLLQAIMVRPKNGRHEVVIGHRRYLAHILLGEVKIKATVRELSDEQVTVIRAIENDQREDLNPIEKAKGYRRLKDKFGWSHETVAQKMGRSRETIKRHLKLLEIPGEYQKAVAQGKLGMAVALCLNEIDDVSFKNYYFTAAIENGVTLDVAQQWANDWRKTRAGPGSGPQGVWGWAAWFKSRFPFFKRVLCVLGRLK